MTLGLNLVIPVVQVVGGIQAQSMALLSDAAHNFSDFTAVLIAAIANRIGKKGASATNTFGYARAEILAASLNVALLVGAAVFIAYEGWCSSQGWASWGTAFRHCCFTGMPGTT